MLKPLELLLYLAGLGSDLVDMNDALPGLLSNVYGTSEPDAPTLAGIDYDFRVCVTAGWIAKYQHPAGDVVHVRPAGHAMLDVLTAVDDAVQNNTPTPYGDV